MPNREVTRGFMTGGSIFSLSVSPGATTPAGRGVLESAVREQATFSGERLFVIAVFLTESLRRTASGTRWCAFGTFVAAACGAGGTATVSLCNASAGRIAKIEPHSSATRRGRERHTGRDPSERGAIVRDYHT